MIDFGLFYTYIAALSLTSIVVSYCRSLRIRRAAALAFLALLGAGAFAPSPYSNCALAALLVVILLGGWGP